MEINKIDSLEYSTKFWRFRQNNRQFDLVEAEIIFGIDKNAKICKTFSEWNDIERRINKGSKSIKYQFNGIDKYVFDIKQTKGKPNVYPNFIGAKNIVNTIDKFMWLNWVKKSIIHFMQH